MAAHRSRAGFAITQAQEQQIYAKGQVLTDVRDAYEGLRANDEIVGLYRSGYLDEAQQSRDITEYAYRHGAASLSAGSASLRLVSNPLCPNLCSRDLDHKRSDDRGRPGQRSDYKKAIVSLAEGQSIDVTTGI